MANTTLNTTCPNCGAEVPAGTNVCPACGKPVPVKKWYSLKEFNPVEIFLLVLGFIMLLVGLVAV